MNSAPAPGPTEPRPPVSSKSSNLAVNAAADTPRDPCQVTLTDFLPKVLGIMTDNMHMNSSSQPNKQQDIDPMADDFDPEAELLAAYEVSHCYALASELFEFCVQPNAQWAVT